MGIFDGGALIVILRSAIACRLLHLCLFGDCHAFFTAGPIRRAILRAYMRYFYSA